MNHKFFLKFFFIASLFISLIEYENSTSKFISYTYVPPSTNIELVVHFDGDYDLLAYKYPSSLTQTDESLPANLENVAVNNLWFILTTPCFFNNYFHKQQVCPPIRHIISFLQKKNSWHQSSDEEPPAIDYLMS